MIPERMIQKYARLMGWSKIDMGCPTAGVSKREDIKQMLKGLYRTNKKIEGNIFHAIRNVKPEYLP
jgi:tRNA 2-thiocytidine biosynthesis protein TtcA